MAGPAPLGHHAGDQLLKQIGPRLVPLLATVNGEIARLGGDEFAVIVKGLRDEQAALAINLSPRVLADLGFVEETERILRRLALPPGCMRFEITETAMLADPARVIETITALNGLGIEFAVDDFGIGFSSLSYLKRLPLRRLKIDRSFVMQMLASEADASIVRSTINLGHDLGLAVVAEGVENADTLAMVTRLGCDEAQGFLIATPRPGAEILDWARSAIA